MILLDGHSLTLDHLLAIAYDAAAVGLAPAALARVDAARAVVDAAARGEAPGYGVNTGFGAVAEVRIPSESLDALQVNLLRSHAAGVGEPLSDPVVRAMMALRANVLAKGYSGIRAATLAALVDLLNRGVLPVVPARGSVGASGDLAPLAHLALVLIGEGEARAAGGPRDSSPLRRRARYRAPRRLWTVRPWGRRPQARPKRRTPGVRAAPGLRGRPGNRLFRSARRSPGRSR